MAKTVFGANFAQSNAALGLAYNVFRNNENLVITSRFLCTKIIDSDVKKFGYKDHSLKRAISFSSFYSL